MGCATGIVKYLVFLANLIFALAGLALVVVGILFKLNVKEAAGALPTEFGLAPILSIVIGAIVFITAFLGCCGAVKESTCMLTTYAIVLLTIFIIQVAIGVYIFLQIKDTNSGDLRQQIDDKIQTLFNDRFKKPESNETLQVTQNLFHCCGVKGPDDYEGKPPNSCCENNKCGVDPRPYNIGCGPRLYEFLINSSQVIGGVAIGIAAVEIIGAIFGLCLASSIRNQYRRHIYA